LIPQHLPEGDDSKERTVQVTGDKRQIEIAQDLIKEVLSQVCLAEHFVMISLQFDSLDIICAYFFVDTVIIAMLTFCIFNVLLISLFIMLFFYCSFMLKPWCLNSFSRTLNFL
jgi:hypothetical protein